MPETPAPPPPWSRFALWILPVLAVGAWAWGVGRLDRWPTGDGPHVLGIAARLALQLRDLDLPLFGWCLQSLLAPHPPGAYLPAVAAYTVVGPAPGVHLVAGALLLWLCWDGIRRLGGGFAGALWLAALPLAWAQAEAYGVDLVAAAAVVQSASHLAASERLARRGHVLGWGAWLGAAFLAKYTAPMFLWAPCLVAGWWTLRHRRWRALLSGVLAFSVVALPWWIPKAGRVYGYIAHSNVAVEQFSVDTVLRTGAWWAPHNLAWYPATVLDGWGWVGVALVLVGVVSPRRPDAWVVATSGAVGGYLVLATQIVREDRYLLPALVLLAALAGGSRLRWWLAPVAAVGAAFAAATFLAAEPAPPARVVHHDIALAGRTWPRVHESYRPTSESPRTWRIEDSLRRLRAAHKSDTGTVGLLCDELHSGPGVRTYLFHSALMGFRWDLASPSMIPGTAPVYVVPFATDDWPSREFSTLLAVIEPGRSRDQEAWLQRSGMVLSESWPLLTGWEGRIYRRR